MRRITTQLVILVVLIFTITSSFGQNTYDSNIDSAKRFYNNKDYIKAAKSYTKAFSINHNLGLVGHRYDAARSWALGGQIDSAFVQLEKIFKTKFDKYSDMVSDNAFNILKGDPRWERGLRLVKKNNEIADSVSVARGMDLHLVHMLDTIYHDDQTLRQKLIELERNKNSSSARRLLVDSIAVLDSFNLIKITFFLDKYGWLGPDKIGEKGNNTLFLVIQHADLAAQLKYLPLLKQAVNLKNATKAQLALLEDRIAVREGRKQIYGSQLVNNPKTGNFYPFPIADPINVDKRRAEVGLGPLNEYLKRWGIDWRADTANVPIASPK